MGKQMTALMYGWIIVLGAILATSVLLGLLLKFTSVNESVWFWATLCAGVISLFTGGLVAGLKGKRKGWLIGGLTGAGFTVFVLTVQYLGYGQTMGLEQSLYHTGYIFCALLGGVVGVNLAGNSEEEM